MFVKKYKFNQKKILTIMPLLLLIIYFSLLKAGTLSSEDALKIASTHIKIEENYKSLSADIIGKDEENNWEVIVFRGSVQNSVSFLSI